MARLQNKLITKQMPWHANMTEMNHLGAMLALKPTVLETRMTQLFTSERYSDNPLTKFLSGMQEKTINNEVWEWTLRGASTRPLVAVERVEPDSNVTPGKGRQIFRIKLEEAWFIPGDVLTPGAANKKYQARVQTQPFKHGKGYIYELQGMWDDANTSMPNQYLEANVMWGKLFSQYGEGAEQSGSTQHSNGLAMQNRMSRYRKQYRVTGDAAGQVLAVALPDNRGKLRNTWIRIAEADYWQQWYQELERGNWYSRSTDYVLDSTGRPVRSGPGIQEQLEDSVQHYYSRLTATLIEEFLMDIFYSRIKPGKGRHIKGFTGEYGLVQFSRAIDDWASKKKGFIQVVDKVLIDKTSSDLNASSLVAGYQFIKYRMMNGAELELVHNPLYDDREINWELDPVTGFPKESQRITFLDFKGEGENGSNITLMHKEGSFKLGYVAGMHSPYGPANKTNMAHSGDYYEMHVQKQQGIHIEDVSRCGELILDSAA